MDRVENIWSVLSWSLWWEQGRENVQQLASSIIKILESFEITNEDKNHVEPLRGCIEGLQNALQQLLLPSEYSEIRHWKARELLERSFKRCRDALDHLNSVLQLENQRRIGNQTKTERLQLPLGSRYVDRLVTELKKGVSLIEKAREAMEANKREYEDSLYSMNDTEDMEANKREYEDSLYSMNDTKDSGTEDSAKHIVGQRALLKHPRTQLPEYSSITGDHVLFSSTASYSRTNVNMHRTLPRLPLSAIKSKYPRRDMNVRIQDRTALLAEAPKRPAKNVKFFLDAGADVNPLIDRRKYFTDLQAAASNGDIEAVRMLLDSGADVNTQGGKYGTALQAAASKENSKIVNMLLDSGADVNIQGGKYGTALQAAASKGNAEIVRILLDFGADANAQGGIFGTALQAAASQWNTMVTMMLLNSGADVNRQGGKHGTALQVAASKGDTVTTVMLLDSGADVNGQGGKYGTALQAAASKGNSEIVSILLDLGADVNIQGGKYGIALQAAVFKGNTVITMMLLDFGADVNGQGGKYGTALQAAAFKGNSEIVSILLGSGADVNAQGGQYGTALQAAVSKWNTEIVKILLNSGADVNAQGGKYGTALQAGVFKWNTEIVKILLDSGADMNMQKGQHGTTLHTAAVFRWDTRIVKMLLDSGADINAQEGKYGTALQAAVSRYNTRMVRILLDSGADVNAQGGKYGTALQAAVSKSNTRIMRILLDSGADVNAQGGKYGTALQAAVSKSNTRIMRILLDSGADVNAQGGKYGTALQAAVSQSNTEIISILLDFGADVNMEGGKYRTALQAAVSKWDTKIVKILLNSGADINTQGGKYGTALQAAAFKGNSEIVSILLGSGADVNAQGGKYGTALQAAVSKWDTKIVKILLNSGADVNAQGGKYGTALQAAVSKWDTETVKMLLDSGADVNMQGGKYGTALQAAASKWDTETVRMLLDSGADVNAKGGKYGTALQAAVSKWHTETVRMLLDSGADVNTQGGKYGTALQAAVSKLDTETVKMLLDSGADVNAQGGKYGTALQAAACKGLGWIVEVLLEAGANANANANLDKYPSQPPLHSAAYKGHTEVVRVLLEAGADVNAHCDVYPCRTALQAAAYKGRTKIVKALLAAGADVNADLDEYGVHATSLSHGQNSEPNFSPLIVASYKRHLKVVKLLLGNGADVNAMSPRGLSPLLAALTLEESLDDFPSAPYSRRQKDVIKYLLAAGAELTSFDSQYASCSPLAEAILEQLLEILKANESQILNDDALLSEEHKEMKTVLASIYAKENLEQSYYRHIVGNEALVQLLFYHTFPQKRTQHITVSSEALAPGHFAACPHLNLYPASISGHDSTRSSGYSASADFLEDPFSYYQRQDDIRERVSVLGGLGWIRLWPIEELDNTRFLTEPSPDKAAKAQVNGKTISWVLVLLLGVYSAILDLQKSYFCCNSIPVLVEGQSPFRLVEVVHIEISEIRSLILQLHIWRYSEPPIMDDHSERLPFIILWQCIATILKALNIASPELDELRPDDGRILYFLILTAKCLCIAVHLCARSYVGDLEAEQFAPTEMIDENMLLIKGDYYMPNRDYPQILVQQRNLSCLGNMLGGPVWIFRAVNGVHQDLLQNKLHETVQYDLLAKLEDVVELWGAGAYIWEAPCHGCNPKLNQVIIGGGRIIGIHDDSSADSTLAASVTAHWVSHADESGLRGSAIHLSTTSKLLIGSQETEFNSPYGGLQENTACALKIHKEFCSSYWKLSPLGTRAPELGLDQIQVGLNVGKLITTGIKGIFKKYPGEKLKSRLLDLWADGNVSVLLACWGLEISFCTGNARRVPLYTLFRNGGVLHQVDNCMGHTWGGYREEIVAALAHESADFRSWFLDLVEAKKRKGLKECALKAFYIAIKNLAETGSRDGKILKTWFADQHDPQAVPMSAEYTSRWIGVVKETNDCAVFALATSTCLVPHLPPVNKPHRYQKCQSSVTNACIEATSFLLSPIHVNQSKSIKKRAYYHIGQHGHLQVEAVISDNLCVARWGKSSLGIVDRARYHWMDPAKENGSENGAKWFCIS